MERPMHVDFPVVGPNVAYWGETTETLGCKVWLPRPKRTYARINTCNDDKVSRTGVQGLKDLLLYSVVC